MKYFDRVVSIVVYVGIGCFAALCLVGLLAHFWMFGGSPGGGDWEYLERACWYIAILIFYFFMVVVNFWLPDRAGDFWKKLAIVFICMLCIQPHLPICIYWVDGSFSCGFHEKTLFFYAIWVAMVLASRKKLRVALATYALYLVYYNIEIFKLGLLCDLEAVPSIVIFNYFCGG